MLILLAHRRSFNHLRNPIYEIICFLSNLEAKKLARNSTDEDRFILLTRDDGGSSKFQPVCCYVGCSVAAATDLLFSLCESAVHHRGWCWEIRRMMMMIMLALVLPKIYSGLFRVAAAVLPFKYINKYTYCEFLNRCLSPPPPSPLCNVTRTERQAKFKLNHKCLL